MAVKNAPAAEPVAAKETPVRGPDGKFTPNDPAASKAAAGVDDWNMEESPGGDIDPATDPLLSALPGEDLPAFGFPASGEPGEAPQSEPEKPAPQAAPTESKQGTESGAESREQADGQNDDEDAAVRALVAQALGATEADDVEGGESGSGRAKEPPSVGGDDAAMMAMIRRVGKKNPDLAAQLVREMVAGDDDAETPVVSPRVKAKGKDLREVWKSAVREGKDLEGIIEIVTEVVNDAIAPIVKQNKDKEQEARAIQAKVQEFEVFKRRYPGWSQYSARMSEVLREIAADVGPQAAARIRPDRLLYLAAPDYFKGAVKAAAAKATQEKKNAAAGRMAVPASSRAGGTLPGQKPVGKDQDAIQKTHDRLSREARVRNFI